MVRPVIVTDQVKHQGQVFRDDALVMEPRRHVPSSVIRMDVVVVPEVHLSVFVNPDHPGIFVAGSLVFR